MKKPLNVPLRVKHFNNQIVDKDALILFDESYLFADPNNPNDYFTDLYKRALAKGRVLEEKNGWYTLYKNSKKKKVIVQGQSYLHILFYLEKRAQAKCDKWLDDLNEEGNKDSHLTLEEFEAKYGISSDEPEEEASEEPSSKGFELEEKDGVTFIKNTTFVISKIL
ncbi:hypothetical protein [Rufibacter roseus]|uniref:Uncharacterized protein n=1 Tax=Rufibacter roseus TaxID=1567108 RepID=A0ABW2DH82_9BACT|nr:hypothetical protein [Rufibacter roseus]